MYKHKWQFGVVCSSADESFCTNIIVAHFYLAKRDAAVLFALNNGNGKSSVPKALKITMVKK